jgi:alginate O-acetyltransferase complex protein AlgI
MIYSNPEFIFLFAITLTMFLLARSQRSRHAVLLAASLLFYMRTGAVDTIIFLSVVVFSWAAVELARRYPDRKGTFLSVGVGLMCLHLFFWKYAPWLTRETQRVFPDFLGGTRLELPLPVGISFFTLQGIAYLVDYGRGEAAFMGLREYFLFKSFFAQLVAGPIVRAPQLQPQLGRLATPSWRQASTGLSLFALGFFKKLFISEHLAPFVDSVFRQPSHYGRAALLSAIFAYSVQIWADFSGYTDMGRGVALMLGIELPENFLSPYLARTPSEFWQRWHITLSQWIRAYVYYPLASLRLWTGRNVVLRVMIVTVVTMGLSGLWHGASFTFILWGLYHGVLLVLEGVLRGSRIARAYAKIIPGRLQAAGLWLTMLVAVTPSWLIFRAQSFSTLRDYLRALLVSTAGPAEIPFAGYVPAGVALCALIQVMTYYSFRSRQFIVLEWLRTKLLAVSPANRGMIAYACGWCVAIVVVGTLFMRKVGFTTPFIYFNF